MLSPNQEQTILEKIENPISFVEDILQDNIWGKQAEILQSITDPKIDTIAIKSCNSSGKTFTASRLALWFLCNYPNSKVITTANTYHQLLNILFKEIINGFSKIEHFYPNSEVLKSKIELDELWFCLGLCVADHKPVNFQGHHANHTCIITDEASGIPVEIFEALKGNLVSGEVRKLIMIGNPNYLSGDFYDAFLNDSPYTKTFTISAFDTPNFTENNIKTIDDLMAVDVDDLNLPRPYLITPKAAKQMYLEQPKNVFKIRVLGQFPDQQSNALVSLSDFENAVSRDLKADGLRVIACDVARFGDDLTTIIERKGDKTLSIEAYQRTSTLDVANLIELKAKQSDEWTAIRVDEVGVGSGVVDILTSRNIQVEGINVGKSATDSEQYGRKRAEDMMKLKRRFETGRIDLPSDNQYLPKLKQELISTEWRITENGKVEIEKKENIKKKIGRSPDFSDALSMAFIDVSDTLGMGVI